jgi:hypothetical protein
MNDRGDKGDRGDLTTTVPIATKATVETAAAHATVVLERPCDLWDSGDLGEIGDFV